jgi:hypothetical protein
MILKGRFTPEQGAVIRKSLEKVMDERSAERADVHPDVAVAMPRGEVRDYQRPQPIATRRADAVERLAETFLAGENGASSGGDTQPATADGRFRGNAVPVQALSEN